LLQGFGSMEKDALYYPYIRIRSVDWLKRTLLIFPHVVRIVPDGFPTQDDKEIWKFENIEGVWGKPLLQRARLNTHGVRRAQDDLVERLEGYIKSDPNFASKFRRGSFSQGLVGRVAEKILTLRGRSEATEVMIHSGKMTHRLNYFLHRQKLSWRSETPDYQGFIAVHPRIGEAIMSTLAIACAKDTGLDIVTDSGNLHRCLIEQDEKGVFDAWIEGRDQVRSAPARRAKGDRLFELIVFQHCDPNKLTAERIAQLGDDRAAISALRTALNKIAAKIPAMQDEKQFEDRLRAAVYEGLSHWERDKVNMAKVAREIFGFEGLKAAGDSLTKALEHWAPAAAAGAASGTLLGAGPGIAIGLMVHGLTSWGRVRKHSQKSPFRYLTKLEKAGVVFSVSA
jgi:hypothetical protein